MPSNFYKEKELDKELIGFRDRVRKIERGWERKRDRTIEKKKEKGIEQVRDKERERKRKKGKAR